MYICMLVGTTPDISSSDDNLFIIDMPRADLSQLLSSVRLNRQDNGLNLILAVIGVYSNLLHNTLLHIVVNASNRQI